MDTSTDESVARLRAKEKALTSPSCEPSPAPSSVFPGSTTAGSVRPDDDDCDKLSLYFDTDDEDEDVLASGSSFQALCGARPAPPFGGLGAVVVQQQPSKEADNDGEELSSSDVEEEDEAPATGCLSFAATAEPATLSDAAAARADMVAVAVGQARRWREVSSRLALVFRRQHGGSQGAANSGEDSGAEDDMSDLASLPDDVDEEAVDEGASDFRWRDISRRLGATLQEAAQQEHECVEVEEEPEPCD